jgi:cell pole-organizing protein PopZ
MNQAAKAQEPSMEEILASIRRIIADDDATKHAPAPVVAAPPPPPPEPEPEPPVAEMPVDDELLAEPDAPPIPETAADDLAADVLQLTESMASGPAADAPGFRTIDGQSDVVFEDEAPEPEPPPRRRPSLIDGLRFQERSDAPALMSASTSAAVDSAFNTLAHTVLVQNARTLEDLVKEMLQPLLKTWLDDNLPGMVERLVRAEIERVSRGRS